MRDKVEPLIDRATRELTKYGEAGVRSLSHVVMSDLGPTFAKFFGPEWVGGDSPAGVVCATINDYLEDYENVLVDYYLTKVALDLTARTVVAFFRSLDKNLNPSSTEKARGKGLKLKQENVDRILDDMEVIEESLSTRMTGRPIRNDGRHESVPDGGGRTCAPGGGGHIGYYHRRRRGERGAATSGGGVHDDLN